ncbi:bifunctional hydroxymethylpyrimidine kinase/phosphomethylpyrimidine kinase [Haloplanus salinus]|uniref:Bifunctional hydroxymethylpyrimidine kinase/phosphomethylpyrimidine kinase n=1 Tax=Haloplanus salinus TaxID=1126245 RepID=A0A368NA59_9EURY|nr:bifunctional hydroxymethylpyrimidine kinase/phosphomethylpyrimidine kinase [Haloplanus salinus]RCU47437.1 bifunctional hydroxymethylpyrimidine kinase/phosphomethylpyrimidine kinase [Haloplanus salinus]
MTRRRAPVSPPVALTVAGSDSGGGAGIQADLKTMESHGVFGTSVVTAVTAQNTRGVERSHVLPVAEIEAQWRAVRDDFDLGAVKTGMLATEPVIDLVTDRAAALDAPLVVDPVMVAASGDRLLDADAEAAYADLVGEATLVTPNADEAAVLTGVEPTDRGTAREAGEALLAMGADAVLVKGGHVGTDADTVVDTLVVDAASRGQPVGDDDDGPAIRTFEHPRIDTDATHGSGCTLSSAVAAHLAHGETLAFAVEAGTAFMERAVRYGLDVGEGPGAVHHLAALREAADRHRTMTDVAEVVEAFVDRDVSRLVPEVGMNVVGATEYAEAVGETAAVEGRITRTLTGVAPNRGVRLGASSHVARFLLSAREFDPDLRFAVNCRFDDETEAATAALDGPVTEYDRDAEPDDASGTMGWGARQAFGAVDADDPTPAAVLDRGAMGKEAIIKLVAETPEELGERVFTLLDTVE